MLIILCMLMFNPNRRHTSMTMRPDSINSERFCANIRKFAGIYDQLSETIQQFNCCYSGHIACLFAVALAFITFSVFGLIHSFASSANKVTVFMSWSNLFYAALYCQIIVQFILFCHRMYTEVRASSLCIT